MWGSWLSCIAAWCGSESPAARHAAMVNPEQSYPPGPSAAHTYGVPSAPYAYRTATPALPDTAGAWALDRDVVSWADPYACRRRALSSSRSLLMDFRWAASVSYVFCWLLSRSAIFAAWAVC